MTILNQLGNIVWIAANVLSALLFLKLMVTGLGKTYPGFTCFLFLGVTRTVLAKTIPMSGTRYAEFYMGWEALFWIVFVFVVLEIHSRVLSGFVGIRTLGRWVIAGSLTVSLVLTAITLPFDMAARGEFNLFEYFLVAERGVMLGLVFLIVLQMWFLTWYPVRLSRNIVLHASLFAVYFLCKAGVLLVQNLGKQQVSQGLNLAWMSTAIAVQLVWLLFFTPRGEQTEMIVGHRWNLESEQQLLAQLQTVNAAIARSARQ
ncbi:MAG: hypothetical protein HYZ37_10600 [Candidatus Solibacter usitatus]|nr:hypothetical protein [Candidatus Solibacter usitatus]